MWYQKQIKLCSRPRGFHLITAEIMRQLPEISRIAVGIAHLFIQHTSASLTINESADPSVRTDFESYFNRIVKENEYYYQHTCEGSDDMPAHLKSSLLGSSLVIPVTNGQFNMGAWQGIYLCEHRNHGGERKIIVTLQGQLDSDK
ncbi:MAG TPA: secondary thiamine-phosphate synthase enzyme YjbQ [Arsenophonus nasoniae]|uniref:secondary thiamine-phosphate synthase enzyme YjbQ n=1 Tax=Arsenophonus nasoniae TaxID=638 RepID=UPI00387A0311